MKLNILSWNIWFDGHFDAVASFLEKSDADIIGLQEVVPNDSSRDTIGFLSQRGYNHVAAPVLMIDRDGRIMANAIFSKHKILHAKTHNLSDTNTRNALQADIQAGNRLLHVFTTHLFHTHQKPSEIQDEQARNLLKVLPRERVILMGDFNATPKSDTIKKMKEMLLDTDPSEQPTWSVYPEGCPTCNPQKIDTRLDYIFVSKDLQAGGCSVGKSKGSDHLPISVTVEV